MSKFMSKAFTTQSFGIPRPTLTEETLEDQSGRVHIVTGGYAGVGQELTGILYNKGATVYVAGRNQEKADKSKKYLQEKYPKATGRLEFLQLDLNDLASVKKTVQDFTSKESRLDVLVNNAGVMFPPAGTKSKQGHDLQFATNCLGPYLFSTLLVPILKETAASSPSGSVRILWAASSGIQVLAPPGGIVMDNYGQPKIFSSQQTNYGQTKVANVFYAAKLQESLLQHGIISISFNPGNLKTELQRHSGGIVNRVANLMLHPAIFGAYTELYSGWSRDVKTDSLYIMPWGRIGSEYVRKDIIDSIKSGLADRFIGWSDSEVSHYAR